MSNRTSLTAALLVAVAACAGDPPADRSTIARSRAGIVDGTVDTGDPAIVELFYSLPNNGGTAICSGELIGPQTVLTAGHCADPVNELGVPAGSTKLCSGSSCNCGGPPMDNSTGGRDFCVYAIFVNSPSYNGVDTKAFKAGNWVLADTYQYNPNYCSANCDSLPSGKSWFDNGLFHLSKPVLDNGQTTVAAAGGSLMPYNRANLSKFVDAQGYLPEVTYVGFGITSANDQTGASAGTKRTVSKHDVQVLDASELEELKSSSDPGLTCSGDSGGPSLMSMWNYLGTAAAPNVIATTSRGDQTCSQAGIDTRIDATTAFVESFMTAHNELPSCGADGQCGFHCSTPDPDCPCIADGTCNPACVNPADSTQSTDPDCTNFALPSATGTVQGNTGTDGAGSTTGASASVGTSSSGASTGASTGRSSSSSGASGATLTSGPTAGSTGSTGATVNTSAAGTSGATFATIGPGTSGATGGRSTAAATTTGGTTGSPPVPDECAPCSGSEPCANASDVCGYVGTNPVGNCAMSCTGPSDPSCGAGFSCLGIPTGSGANAVIYACWPASGACPGVTTTSGPSGQAASSGGRGANANTTGAAATAGGRASSSTGRGSSSTSTRSTASAAAGTLGTSFNPVAASSSGGQSSQPLPASGCGTPGRAGIEGLILLIPLLSRRRRNA